MLLETIDSKIHKCIIWWDMKMLPKDTDWTRRKDTSYSSCDVQFNEQIKEHSQNAHDIVSTKSNYQLIAEISDIETDNDITQPEKVQDQVLQNPEGLPEPQRT